MGSADRLKANSGGILMTAQNKNERRAQEDLSELMNLTIERTMIEMNCALIAKVIKVNADTIDCTPVINKVRGNGVDYTLTTFIEVPVIFPYGGSAYQAMPIAVGDYALLIVTDRCFDRFWDGADFEPPAIYRVHDLSDCVAFVGIQPKSKAIPIPQKITTVGDHVQTGDYTRTGTLDQTGDMHIKGNLYCSGTIFCDDIQPYQPPAGPPGAGAVTVDGIGIKAHTHAQDPDSAGNTQQDTKGAKNP